MPFDEDGRKPGRPDDTGVYRADEATRFQPGKSGNPTGRPKGARSKLSEEFLAALLADFGAHGAETIAIVRENDPATYVRVIASLLPREVAVEKVGFDGNDAALDREIERLMKVLGILL